MLERKACAASAPRPRSGDGVAVLSERSALRHRSTLVVDGGMARTLDRPAALTGRALASPCRPCASSTSRCSCVAVRLGAATDAGRRGDQSSTEGDPGRSYGVPVQVNTENRNNALSLD